MRMLSVSGTLRLGSDPIQALPNTAFEYRICPYIRPTPYFSMKKADML